MPFARLFTHSELDEWNKLQFLFVSEIQNRLSRNNGRDAGRKVQHGSCFFTFTLVLMKRDFSFNSPIDALFRSHMCVYFSD